MGKLCGGIGFVFVVVVVKRASGIVGINGGVDRLVDEQGMVQPQVVNPKDTFFCVSCLFWLPQFVGATLHRLLFRHQTANFLRAITTCLLCVKPLLAKTAIALGFKRALLVPLPIRYAYACLFVGILAACCGGGGYGVCV